MFFRFTGTNACPHVTVKVILEYIKAVKTRHLNQYIFKSRIVQEGNKNSEPISWILRAANFRSGSPSPGVARFRFISTVWPRITPEDQSALLRCKSGLAQQEQDHKTNGAMGQRWMGRKLKIRQSLVISLSTLEVTLLSSATGLQCGFWL